METLFTVVSSKGQIVIPASLREKLGIETGTRIAISNVNKQLILQPITEQFIRSLRGRYRGSSLAEVRDKEHRIEKDRLSR